MRTRIYLAAAIAALSPTLAAQRTLRTHDGNAADGFHGFAVADLGDLDGDGIGDYAIGASNATYPGIPGRGRVAVHSGASGALLLILIGDRAGARFGWTVAGIGDVTGDGVPDLAVGAPFDDTNGFEAGRISAFSGADGRRIWTALGTGGARSGATVIRYGSRLGTSIATLHDLNRDSADEIVVGAPSSTLDRIAGVPPEVLVLDGRGGHTLLRIAGSEEFGHAMTSVPDLDGDGRPELAIAAPSAPNGPFPGAGMITVFTHRALRTQQIAPWLSIGGNAMGDFLGRGLICPGDLSGDGVPDLLCHGGIHDQHQNGAPTIVEVRSLADTRVVRRTRIQDGSIRYGRALAALDDLDGDGIREYAVGADRYDGNNGLIEIFDGATGRSLHRIIGRGGERLGYALASIGDIDHDGRRELLAGAVFGSTSAQFAGRAHVVSFAEPGSVRSFGTACQLIPGADLRLTGSGTGAVGTTLALRSGHLLRPTAGVLLVGFSERTWAGGSLPLSLLPLGSPCQLLVSPDITARLVSQRVPATPFQQFELMLALPSGPGSHGHELFFQFAAFDPAAPAGFATSNGVALRTGG